MPSSCPPLSFFSLPRELRDTIYHFYLLEPEGYFYDLESGKLRAHGKRRIDLALVRTCSAIATEMYHLPLQINVLHFSTSSDPLESERSVSAHFDVLLTHKQLGNCLALFVVNEPTLSHYRTADVNAKLAFRYPQFAPMLQPAQEVAFSGLKPCFSSSLHASGWGEAESLFVAFQSHMIELLSTNNGFREALVNFYEKEYAAARERDFAAGRSTVNDHPGLGEDERAKREREDRLEYHGKIGRDKASMVRRALSMPSPDPWMIPTDSELAQMNMKAGLSGTSLDDAGVYGDGYGDGDRDVKTLPWKRIRWRFSAAAAAIRFFKSISQATCSGIRKVVLHENRLSVARPESHALGLIPFCVQNPQLHIERRVNVWSTLLTTRPVLYTNPIHTRAKDLLDYFNGDDNERWDSHDSTRLLWVSESFCRWITEASALSAHGMPDRSFSLIFDGDPAPDQSSDLFELVKEDAVWQVAEADWYTSHSSSQGFEGIRQRSHYKSEVFPQAINDIVEGKSCIRCNFPTGKLHHPQRVLDMTRHITYEPTGRRNQRRMDLDWAGVWYRQRLRIPFEFSPPSPSSSDLALQDFILEA
ncbi:MAG: hypothetical protein Q9198_002350 [Flavoplaca austrocitrina]